MEQPKGWDELLCLIGADGFYEVFAAPLLLDSEAVRFDITVTGTGIAAVWKAAEKNSEVHPPARPGPWPDEVPFGGLQRAVYHSGEGHPAANSRKCTEGEGDPDVRLAARLEAVNQRLRMTVPEVIGRKIRIWTLRCDKDPCLSGETRGQATKSAA